MLRKSLLVLQHKASSHQRTRSPYEVLGVTATTPFAEIKKKYRELARQHHPDTVSGNPHLFREINAAYSIIKNAEKTGKRNDLGNESSRGASAAARGKAHNDEEERLKREADKGQSNYDRNQWFVVQHLWESEGFEKLTVLASIFFLGLWTAETILSSKKQHRVKDLENLTHAQQQPKERFRPSTEEEQLETIRRLDAGEEVYRTSVPMAAPASPQSQASLAVRLRASRQQRFTDVKEFLYHHDIDGADVRRIIVSRFPVDLVEEPSIFTQCKFVRQFNSNILSRSFEDSVVDELVESIEKTQWAHVDAALGGTLVANALIAVPALSPSASKWTLVEYKSTDTDNGPRTQKGKGKVGTTECLFALQNERFADSSNKSAVNSRGAAVQRIVISGMDELHPFKALEQERMLESGALKQSDLVRGGIVKMKAL